MTQLDDIESRLIETQATVNIIRSYNEVFQTDYFVPIQNKVNSFDEKFDEILFLLNNNIPRDNTPTANTTDSKIDKILDLLESNCLFSPEDKLEEAEITFTITDDPFFSTYDSPNSTWSVQGLAPLTFIQTFSSRIYNYTDENQISREKIYPTMKLKVIDGTNEIVGTWSQNTDQKLITGYSKVSYFSDYDEEIPTDNCRINSILGDNLQEIFNEIEIPLPEGLIKSPESISLIVRLNKNIPCYLDVYDVLT